MSTSSSGTTTERIYLDYAATAPMRRDVWEAMTAELGSSYNPVSAHAFGRRAHRCLETARERIAGALECDRNDIYFTGGGTPSNNLAILGFVRAQEARNARVLVSSIEHSAILEAARRAAREGAEVHTLPVRGCGTVDLEALEARLAETDAPTLVSVMWANNEVGTVQPVEEIAALSHRHGALFHTDAVQAVGKIDVSLQRLPADLLTATAHKLGGPGGIGLLLCREETRLEPLTYGGGHERKLWPGTPNPVAACGFAEAFARAVDEREGESARWMELRETLAARVREEIPRARIHAANAERRLPSLLSVGIPGCDPGALLVTLDLEGIAVSAGSACGSGSMRGSAVLEAMGVAAGESYATVRFSFGPATTSEEIDRAGDVLVRAATRLAGALA